MRISNFTGEKKNLQILQYKCISDGDYSRGTNALWSYVACNIYFMYPDVETRKCLTPIGPLAIEKQKKNFQALREGNPTIEKQYKNQTPL